jgi:hypothetical protein
VVARERVLDGGAHRGGVDGGVAEHDVGEHGDDQRVQRRQDVGARPPAIEPALERRRQAGAAQAGGAAVEGGRQRAAPPRPRCAIERGQRAAEDEAAGDADGGRLGEGRAEDGGDVVGMDDQAPALGADAERHDVAAGGGGAQEGEGIAAEGGRVAEEERRAHAAR